MSVSKVISALTGNILGTGPAKGGDTTPIAALSQIELNNSHEIEPVRGKLGFSSISYPSDVLSNPQGGHYMMFYINVPGTTKYPYMGADGVPVGGVEYSTAKEDQVVAGKTITKKGQDYAVKAYDKKPTYQSRLNLKTAKSVPNKNVQKLMQEKQKSKTSVSKMMTDNNFRGATKRISDCVALYLPAEVQDSYTVQYNNTETGLLGFIAAGGGSIIDAFRRGDYEETARRGLQTTRGILEEVLKNVGASAVELATQAEGGYEMFNKILGRGLNPYMEVLFSGVQLRQFTYNFTFMPRNFRETRDVQKIIQLFKFHAAPELRGNNLFLGLPSEFDIHYMYQPPVGDAKENEYYNKIATCVLSNCTVNYTPDGVKSFRDGSPTQITMELQFKETELLTKDRINEGF
jgi:hypothetical protein